jgi:hypothetical protein
MLLPYTTLVYYGPAAVAAVTGGDGAVETAQAKTSGRAGAVLAGDGSIPFAKGTRLISSPAILEAVGAIAAAAPKGRLRAGAIIGITGLTQSDVTGAVLEAEVYPGITLKKALRGILSAQGGKVGIAGNTVTIRDPADTKNVITATTDAEGRRTAVTLDLD